MATPNLDVFQVIADPSRRAILGMLKKQTQNINSIAENFEMSRPAISKHIRILEYAGFISIQEMGRERHCKLSQKGFIELKKWISFFDSFWDDKLNNLDKALKS